MKQNSVPSLEAVKQENSPIIYDDGLVAELVKRVKEGDIDKVILMCNTKSEKSKEAIKEYRIESHSINERSDKKRKNKPDYETNKLPRPWQFYINEISVFFMFNNRIKILLDNQMEEIEELKPYFEDFKKFLDSFYFHERLRQAKRIAGSELECAILYQLYTNANGNFQVNCKILSNSGEHQLYTLFNKYDKMVAFGDRYYARDLELNVVEHFDIYMKDKIYRCTRGNGSNNWTVVEKENPSHKIPIIYYSQEKEWHGVERRIDRDEWLDSKGADTTEYFNDPYMKVSADVVGNRLADAEEVGKVMKVNDKDSVFEFVAPPEAGDLQQNEKKNLKASILEGTFTPDFSYESIMGLGTLSGEAIRRMSLPGYIKRSMHQDTYNELIMRDLNLAKAILSDVIYLNDSEKAQGIRRLNITFELTDPFIGALENNSEEIQAWRTSGAMSVRTAVELNSHVKNKELEVERIFEEKERLAKIEAAANASNNSGGDNE